ncbi:hypothetical protein [Buttiauxella gaviniae]|uniref:hypothetical protein n=1 Tax=Buttiauxella gaviniae TaxID=82990 RepID=UPI0012EE1C50|nr:hypothetical protein [Buttiauxella gaviniae]
MKITVFNDVRVSLPPATTDPVSAWRMPYMEFVAELTAVGSHLPLVAITTVKHLYRYKRTFQTRVPQLSIALLTTQPALTGHFCHA